jgi:hypothetical protein
MYAVTPTWFPLDKLRQSIQMIGMITPIRLEREEPQNLRVVSGFRRMQVAREIGLDEIPSIISPKRVSRDLFIEALWENLGCRSFTELEKCIILDKLKSQFALQESVLIKEFLPLLEIRSDRYHLDRCLRIAHLPERLQKLMIEGDLYTDIALGIAAWKVSEQGFFTELVKRYQLGRNRQKELFEVLGDLRVSFGTDVESVWEQIGAKVVDRDSKIAPQIRFAGISRLLKAKRYPTLARYEEKYRELKNSLRLPAGVKLELPPYFEGSRVSFSIDASTAGELRDLVKESNDLLGQEELDQIFALL